ncbi:MAG: hypothetical protein ABR562_02195 [Thermoplasmatota archaeon]|nr:hypothetical protein [Halobacteriales archaeon]
MSTPHSVHELQEGLGQTGRFGEFFIVLGILIFVGGAILAFVGHHDLLHDGTGLDGGNSDAVQVGWLFFFEGLGFTLFGIMVMLAGWGRHHGEVT